MGILESDDASALLLLGARYFFYTILLVLMLVRSVLRLQTGPGQARRLSNCSSGGTVSDDDGFKSSCSSSDDQGWISLLRGPVSTRRF